MKCELHPHTHLAPPAEQVEFALARIEHSAAFRGSPRHRALLRHLVGRVLANDLAGLKESVIAVEVFGRPAGTFDPSADTIVRVEARRLRARLSSYYAADGHDSPIRIELPVGSYAPIIATHAPPLHDASMTRRARDLAERGEHYLRQPLSREGLEAALERFEEAARESPDYAAAFVGMGRAWLNLATGWYHDPATASKQAAEALQRAIVLEPSNAVAHVLLAAIRHQFEHDWPAARRGFERGVALAPQLAFVHSAYGCHLSMHGALDEAERELLLARQLDPLYVNARSHMVNLRIAQGRLEDAESEILALQDMAPSTMWIAGLHGAIAMFRGDAEAAVAQYTKACDAMPGHGACFIALAGAHAMAGRDELADRIVADTLQRCEPRSISPYVLAIYEARRGRIDAAFSLLERVARERDPLAMQARGDPSFAPLRDDPRWAAWLQSMRSGRR
jgi:tetratricopeptide (TPR) repeat protein